MNIEHARLAGRLAEVARDFHSRGWCLGTAGNFSVTLSHEPLQLLISRSGRNKQALSERDFVVVDGPGAPEEQSGEGASSDAKLHAVIAASRSAGSVLHTHSVANTLLGEHFAEKQGFMIRGYEMLKGLGGIESHDAGLFLPVLVNTGDRPALAADLESLLEKRPDARGFLIAGHGLYTWGETLDEARRHVEILEFLLECVSRRIRFTPFEG